MAIDSPVDAVKSQYPETSDTPLSLALLGCELAFPPASIFFKFFGLLKDRFSAKGMEERMTAFWNALVDEQKFLEAGLEHMKVRFEDLAEALQLATFRDAEAFNDKKRDRYLKILGNAVRSEDEIQDLATFIRDVESLGELDIMVLKVLNEVMNKAGDWVRHPSGVAQNLHPNTFIQRRQELAVQIAHRLAMKGDLNSNEGKSFSHEEGYGTCARLQGFGLAHEVDVGSREVPNGDYCFRPSKRGLMLLKLIGEAVPNWEHYFPAQKKAA